MVIQDGGSWSSDHKSSDPEVPAEVAGATPAGVAPTMIAQSQGPMDLKRESSINPAKELLRIPEEEVLGDPEGDFIPGLIQSTIQAPNLERLRKKF